MLWMKSWLETRFRLCVAFAPFVLLVALGFAQANHLRPNNPIPAVQRLSGSLAIFTVFWMMPAAMLAGAGIKTQAPFQATKGLHGSVHFTLSLPVSRLRLLQVRAGMGMLEVVVVILLGTIGFGILLPRQFPELGFPAMDMLRYGITVLAFTLAVYALSTLFATFMDDMWQTWGTLIAVAAARGLSSLVSLPRSMDVFQALSGNSALVTHSLPTWPIVLSLAVAVCLFSAAARSVQERDY
jgi:putative exporter of polyketide antibiotics